MPRAPAGAGPRKRAADGHALPSLVAAWSSISTIAPHSLCPSGPRARSGITVVSTTIWRPRRFTASSRAVSFARSLDVSARQILAVDRRSHGQRRLPGDDLGQHAARRGRDVDDEADGGGEVLGKLPHQALERLDPPADAPRATMPRARAGLVSTLSGLRLFRRCDA